MKEDKEGGQMGNIFEITTRSSSRDEADRREEANASSGMMPD